MDTISSQNYKTTEPRMMSVRQIAGTGLMSEHALRIMLKEGRLPAIFIGRKALINFDKLCAQLQGLESNVTETAEPEWFGRTK